MENKSETLAWH